MESRDFKTNIQKREKKRGRKLQRHNANGHGLQNICGDFKEETRKGDRGKGGVVSDADGIQGAKGRSRDSLLLKESIRKGIRKEKGKVIVTFADMKKAAFDKLRRKRIWERMEKKGVSRNLIENKRSV